MTPSIGQTSIDDGECYVQEWGIRSDAGSVVRGRIRLNRFVRLFFVPRTENEELTGAVSRSLPLLKIRLTRGNRLFRFLLDIPKDNPVSLHMFGGPNLLMNIRSVQSLRLSNASSSLALAIPKPSLHPCTFAVRMRVVEPAFTEEQLRQEAPVPKLFIVPVERICDLEDCLEVCDGLRRVVLGGVYLAEDAVVLVDPELFALV